MLQVGDTGNPILKTAQHMGGSYCLEAGKYLPFLSFSLSFFLFSIVVGGNSDG